MTVLMLQDVLCEKWQETFVKYIWGFLEIYVRGLLVLLQQKKKKKKIPFQLYKSHKQHIE